MIYVFVAIYVAVIAGGFFMYRRFNKKTAEALANDVETRVQQAKTAQDMLGFETISTGVVKVDANRFRAYIDVEPVNFYYMTAGEQDILEQNFRAFLDGLRFPVQVSVNSVPLDLSEHLNQLEKEQAHLPESLQMYAREMAFYTRDWSAQYAPITKRYTIVLCFDFEQNTKKPIRPEIVEQQAHQELDMRCQQVAEALSRAGFGTRRMNDTEIIALLYQVLNRHPGAALAARSLSSEGLTSVYATRSVEDSADQKEGDSVGSR